jgi:hypothetical protein
MVEHPKIDLDKLVIYDTMRLCKWTLASRPHSGHPPNASARYPQHGRLEIELISLKTHHISKPYPQQNLPLSRLPFSPVSKITHNQLDVADRRRPGHF